MSEGICDILKRSERKIDVFHPKVFKDVTISMPLMDCDDYFIREGKISWENETSATLEVS